MGHKIVCFSCRKAFSIGTDFMNPTPEKCPECGGVAHFLNHKFRPPGKTDLKKWAVVQYLFANGFIYNHVSEYKKDKQGRYMKDERGRKIAEYVQYPETMKEAEEFVQTFGKKSY